MPIKKVSLTDQIAAQGLALAAGETAITYRDVNIMLRAVSTLAQRFIPKKGARTFLLRAARALKGHADDYIDERTRIQHSHLPVDAEEGEPVQFTNAAVMAVELAALETTLAPIALPGVFLEEWLPTADKTHPNNADGLTAVLADLLYLFPLAPDDDVAEAA